MVVEPNNDNQMQRPRSTKIKVNKNGLTIDQLATTITGNKPIAPGEMLPVECMFTLFHPLIRYLTCWFALLG